MPSGLKGTSHSFPQSAQVALCISLLPYDIFSISTPTTYLRAERFLHSTEIDKVETYKHRAFGTMIKHQSGSVLGSSSAIFSWNWPIVNLI